MHNRRIITAFFISLVVAGLLLALFLTDLAIRKRTVLHNFEVAEAPTVLTEEMAITFSRKALSNEGFNAWDWEPLEQQDRDHNNHELDDEKYVARNAANKNRASIVFINKHEGKARGITIELKGKSIACEVTIPK